MDQFDNVSPNQFGEYFFREHVLVYALCGTIDLYQGHNCCCLPEGAFAVICKNHCVRFIKRMNSEGQSKIICLELDQTNLRHSQSRIFNISSGMRRTSNWVWPLTPTPLLNSFFDLLGLYWNHKINTNKTLMELKVQEATLMILCIHPELRSVLFDFSPPGKIDLVAYMNAHYRDNLGLRQFAFLTGRSLATFKRDFNLLYGEPPGQWLLRKRLLDALHLIRDQRIRPSQFYKKIGFKSLSHFSNSFKKTYKCTPREISLVHQRQPIL